MSLTCLSITLWIVLKLTKTFLVHVVIPHTSALASHFSWISLTALSSVDCYLHINVEYLWLLRPVYTVVCTFCWIPLTASSSVYCCLHILFNMSDCPVKCRLLFVHCGQLPPPPQHTHTPIPTSTTCTKQLAKLGQVNKFTKHQQEGLGCCQLSLSVLLKTS